MALKRWRWIGGPVLAALLVAIALLPPRVPTGTNLLFGLIRSNPYWYQTGNERTQFGIDLQSAQWTQKAQLRRAVLAASILAATRGPRALKSEDGLITLVYEAPLTVDSARTWLNAAARELALYPTGPAKGQRLAVALLSSPKRVRPGEASYEWGIRQLTEQETSTGACIVTVNLLPGQSAGRSAIGHDLAGKAVSRVLGACALYARFGVPGAGVSQWALAGLSNSWWDPLTAQLQEARRRVRRNELPRSVDWGNSGWYGEVQWVEIGCLRGAAGLCLRTAGLGRGTESRFFYFNYYPYSSGPRSKLIAYLLATRSPAQFAAFWRAPQPAAEALASAYGEPADKLAMSAFEHWYAAPAPGGLWGNARDQLAGFVWAALALGLAVVAGRRWTIES